MAPAGPVYSPKRNIQGLNWACVVSLDYGVAKFSQCVKSDMRLTMKNYETYVTFDEPNPAIINI